MKKIYALIISLFLVSFAHSQNQVVYQQTNEQTFLLNYNYGQMNNDGQMINLFNILSQSLGKNTQNTELVIKASYMARVVQISPQQSQLYIQLNNIYITGDTAYQGFSLASTQIPDSWSFDLQLVASNGQVVRQIPIRNIAPNNVLVNYTLNDSLNWTGYKLELKNLYYRYTNNQVGQMTNRLNDIKEYYQVDFNAPMQKLRQLIFTEVDSFENNTSTVKNVETYVADVERKNLVNKLNLNQQDPAGFVTKLNEVKYRLQLGNTELNKIRIDYSNLLYQKGMAATDANKSENYFRKACGGRFQSHPQSWFRIAQLQANKGLIDSATAKLIQVKSVLPADLTTESMKLADGLFYVYISNAKTNNNRKQYKASIDQLNQSRNLCREFGLYGCNDSINKYVTNAWQGIYAAYIDSSRTALNNKNYILADEYVEDALRTQRNNPREITSAITAETLRLKIKNIVYADYITKGRGLQKTGNHKAALALFENASALEGKYSIATDAQLPTLIKQSAVQVIIAELNGIKGMIANNVEVARTEYIKTSESIQKYRLASEKDIKKLSDDISSKISSQECQNAATDLRVKMTEAGNLETDKKYTSAEIKYNNAIKFCEQNPTCNLNKKMVETAKERIAPAVKYEQLDEQVKNSLENGDYPTCVATYKDLEKFAQDNNTSSFGLQPKPFIEWAKAVENRNSFAYFLAEDFKNKNELGIACHFLQKALNEKYKAKATKVLQQQLGAALAIRDYNNKQPTSADIKVLDYTQGKSELKALKKAYLKQYKMMGKK
jgi:hypothetical protein